MPRRYLTLREIDWRIVAGLIALNTLCLTAYRQLDYVANFRQRPLLLTFSEEAAGGLAGFVVFPLVYLVATRYSLRSSRWRRNLLIHLAALCLISIVHTTVIAIVRGLTFPPLGFGNESYGYMPARYPMEFSHLFIYYWVMVGLIYLFHEIRFAREHEVSQAQLETKLVAAQLENLRLRLDPHFLFNTLNMISAALYEDARAADEMIGRLGELLRRLLKGEQSQLVSLSCELETLLLYTRIVKARFEDRFYLSLKVNCDCRDALVPNLILQPLVENAVQHGVDSLFQLHIEIAARLEGQHLLLTVRDHGGGIDDSAFKQTGIARTGLGLQNTAARLEGLYPGQHTFRIGNAPGGGVLVSLRLPLQMAHSPEPSVAEANFGTR